MSRANVLSALFLFLLAVAVGFKYFKTPEIEGRALPKDAVILAFGDSLTYGIGAGKSYPEQLEERIGRRVINGGIPGELSAEGLRRLPSMLDAHRPALLLLCHGGNDILRNKPKEALRHNLEAMVSLARERNTDVILIAVPQFSLLRLSSHPVYEEIAENSHIPIENGILSHLLSDNRYKSDRIHLNDAGYEKMAEAVEKVIRKRYRIKEWGNPPQD